MTSIPSNYMLLSSAVASLEDGMFGGMARPEMVRQVKNDLPRLPVGFGPRRQEAAGRLYGALVAGELPVYVEFGPKMTDRSEPQILPVGPTILKSLPRSRGGLPDRAVRVPTALLSTGAIDRELFRALSAGRLLLRQSEFENWYARERQRGKWPSQRGRKQRRVGRPSKHTALHTSIIALVNSGRWDGNNNTVAELTAMLLENGRAPVSHDTVARAVDHLFQERGDERLRRQARKKLT
jgi:hypothetical protein